MTKPFEYTDSDGDELKVTGDTGGPAMFTVRSKKVRKTVYLPTGSKLTVFLQAVADDTHVVIPVADLPEVEFDGGDEDGPLWQATRYQAYQLHERSSLEQGIRDRVAILRAMDAYEAEQGELAKVQELDKLAARLRKAANQPDPKLSTFSRMAREAIAWHEEQEG